MRLKIFFFHFLSNQKIIKIKCLKIPLQQFKREIKFLYLNILKYLDVLALTFLKVYFLNILCRFLKHTKTRLYICD